METTIWTAAKSVFGNLAVIRADFARFVKLLIGPDWTRYKAIKDEASFEPATSIEDLQKKITPWHTLIPLQQELELVINNDRKPSLLDEAGLVLVASLIDKGTNLGGLCRTCEIFKVREFVIGSLKSMEDKQFQSLAVTAQKWLNIKEVFRPAWHISTPFQGFLCRQGSSQVLESLSGRDEVPWIRLDRRGADGEQCPSGQFSVPSQVLAIVGVSDSQRPS
jgi:hypothetical protein